MRSKVAEEMREATDAAVMAMSPEERVELALALGEAAVEDYACARGIAHDEALRLLRRERRAGRRYSACIEALDEGKALR